MARRSRLAPIAGVPEEGLRQAEALLDNPEPFQTAAHITTNCCEAVTYPAAAAFTLALVALRTAPGAPAAHLIRDAGPSLLLALFIAVLAILVFGEALPK